MAPSANIILVALASAAALRATNACEIMGNPNWDQYCTSGSVVSSSCASGCGTSSSAPMSACCTSDCCAHPAPPPPPTPPGPSPAPNNCDGGETACYSKPGCGYCISSDYDSDCLPGDMTGAFTPVQHNCDRQWVAGVYRTEESMCVVAVGKDDVRCLKDCSYGLPDQGETFIVPSQAACNQYDSAYKIVETEASLRHEVHVHVSAYLLTHAVADAHVELLNRAGFYDHARYANETFYATRMLNASLTFPTQEEMAIAGRHVDDLTRDLLHSKIENLEVTGLGKLEEGACEGVCTPCTPFCHVVFTSEFATTVNRKVMSIPVVQNVNNWLADTAADAIPDGARNLMNDVIDDYNKVQRAIEPIEHLVSTCASVASSVANTLFGWL